MNAFEVLGISPTADQAQVRSAYRTQVKKCHPDQFEHNKEAQLRAQERLIQLNLAYEEALRASMQRQVGFSTLPTAQAMSIARKLMDQGSPENALGQMARAESKTDDWYFLQGQILMKLRQYASAHQAFRAAIRLSPANNEYRTWALDAAIAVKKHQKLPYRLADWADSLLHHKK